MGPESFIKNIFFRILFVYFSFRSIIIELLQERYQRSESYTIE